MSPCFRGDRLVYVGMWPCFRGDRRVYVGMWVCFRGDSRVSVSMWPFCHGDPPVLENRRTYFVEVVLASTSRTSTRVTINLIIVNVMSRAHMASYIVQKSITSD